MMYSATSDKAEAVSDEIYRDTHELKTDPEYFKAVSEGRKKFELRRNDRGFKVGDLIMLREWTASGYTGRRINCRIDYILNGYDGLDPDYVILSITLL